MDPNEFLRRAYLEKVWAEMYNRPGRAAHVDKARAGRDHTAEIIMREVLLIGGKRDKTRQWVAQVGPTLSFWNRSGSTDLYRLRGKNRRGVPVYELEEEDEVEIQINHRSEKDMNASTRQVQQTLAEVAAEDQSRRRPAEGG